MLSFGLICKRRNVLQILFVREVHKSYYDSLGLTPKATRADIKKAYYKMSMLYHPDKGDGSPEKFKEISSAYEVLGNTKLRKLYDKGLLPLGAAKYAAAKETSQPTEKEFEAKANQGFDSNFYENVTGFEDAERKRKIYTGKSEHYDYDAWTKAHYAEIFSRQNREKTERVKHKEVKIAYKRMDGVILFTIFLSLFSVSFFVFNTSRLDSPSEQLVRKKS